VSVASGPLGLAYDGFWTMIQGQGGAFIQAWPKTNDLASAQWDSYLVPVPLPAPYVPVSAIDVTMQGEARWDAFVVGATTGDASGPSATLFHYYWDRDVNPESAGWESFGDASSVPGIATLVSAPTVTSYSPGRYDAFVLGEAADGHHLLHVWCDDRMNGVHVVGTNCDTPTGWEDLGMPPDGAALVGDPQAGSWPSGTTDGGHLAVVCAAGDGTVRLFRQDNGDATWTVLTPPSGLTFAHGPAIAGAGDGRYLIAVPTTDGSVWQWLYDGGGGTWTIGAPQAGSTAIDLVTY
jgi:hypothetical protein